MKRKIFHKYFSFKDLLLYERDIKPVYGRRRLAKDIPPDADIMRARDDTFFYGHVGTMAQDTVIREVAEVGFSPYVIFRDKIGVDYNHIVSMYFDKFPVEKFFAVFDKHYNVADFTEKSYSSFSGDDKRIYDRYLYSKNLAIYFSLSINKDDISILVLSEKFSDKLQKLIDELESQREKKKNSLLNIICHNGRSFHLESFELAPPVYDTFDFYECYNDEFVDISKQIKDKLMVENGKGIVLFHGGFGNGKTTYLRHLITSDLGKKVIYMPPDMVDRISSPDFVRFLMENPNSVLFIEDAENILRAREAGGSQAVSNLLNVSDGILGDALHLQIVCTFNCDKDILDQALLRPGRLIAEYRFDKLKRDKASALVKKVYGDDTTVTEDMSLAEIFNLEEKKIISKEQKKKFGFV